MTFEGKPYPPPKSSCWKTDEPGMQILAGERRLVPSGETLRYVLYHDDYPVMRITNLWADTSGADDPVYAVQTNTKVIQRCMFMCTSPGDLVLDPTCGGGTTAYVSEQLGRRWVTCDTSRIPLALARQRLLTATYEWYQLLDPSRGPGAGFVYRRKQNRRGQEVGGIVPHLKMETLTNNEKPQEEILVDRPEVENGITRVTGAFCLEATIPTPMEWDEETKDAGEIDADNNGSFTDRMIEVLRRSPVLRLEGNRTVTLKNVRPPAKSLSLSAEALVDATAEGQSATLADAVQESAEKSGLALPLSARPVAFVFGPENGAVNIRLVDEAAREATRRATRIFTSSVSPSNRTPGC